MADNLVSQPPLNVPIIDKNGMASRVFAIWLRDIYRRTSYKGGNAIDDNKNQTDDDLLELTATLKETIEQVNENIQGISDNADNLDDHEGLKEAHGSNGDIVGFGDVATEAIYGLVKKMASLSDAIESTVSVVSPDVAAAPAAYDQAYTQTMADLSNENKASINQLTADFNAAVLVLNELIARSKTAGQMT